MTPNDTNKYIETKKWLDVFISLLILIIAFPFMLLIALLLTVILKTSPFIIQKRGLALNNQVFNMYKFKTIAINQHNKINNDDILFKPDLSRYVPVFCRWLRSTGLDELPQFINVLKGDMSIIGPRPLMMSDLVVLQEKYKLHNEVRSAITMKPGITGMWQAFGDRIDGVEKLVELDFYYFEKCSLIIDVRIMLRTLILVMRGKHTDAIFAKMSEPPSFRNQEIIA